MTANSGPSLKTLLSYQYYDSKTVTKKIPIIYVFVVVFVSLHVDI